jgi:parallel beta-helix repeat protein
MVRWLFLSLLALVVVPAAAKEWFVAPNGNDDTGNGLPKTPYRTLTRVLNTSNGVTHSGDTIILRAGTYNECDVRLRMPLTLRGYPSEHAHIHCDLSKPDSVVVQIDPHASGSRISDLELSGSMYYGVMLQTEWSRGEGDKLGGASNIVLENLKIHDTGRDAIKITPHCDHVTIRRSEIWNTGAADPPGTPTDKRNAEGIDNVGGAYMLVEDNHIHDIATTGLYFKGGASDVVVQRNRIENTGVAGILVGFDTSEEYFDLVANPKYYESVRGIVRNNVVRNTAYAGIGLYAAKDAVVANNTIINTARLGHAAIYFGTPLQDYDPKAGRPPSVNPLIRNNLVIQDGGACVAIRWSNELGGPGGLRGRIAKLIAQKSSTDAASGLSGLSGSPNTDWNGYYDAKGDCRFIDERPPQSMFANSSFAQWQAGEKSDEHSLVATFAVDARGHLPAGSPAIKRGTALEQVTDDIDGDKRSAPYDIGADERTESGAHGER